VAPASLLNEAVARAFARLDEGMEYMAAMSALLRAELETMEGIRFVTPATGALPNIINVTFDDAARLDGEALIVGMDLLNVAVSNGSACTSGSLQPSHVLSAMGLPPEQAKAAVRFSLSRYTTPDEIHRGAEALREVVGRMRGKNFRLTIDD
jgi:cysteine desulfurase